MNMLSAVHPSIWVLLIGIAVWAMLYVYCNRCDQRRWQRIAIRTHDRQL